MIPLGRAGKISLDVSPEPMIISEALFHYKINLPSHIALSYSKNCLSSTTAQ